MEGERTPGHLVLGKRRKRTEQFVESKLLAAFLHTLFLHPCLDFLGDGL